MRHYRLKFATRGLVHIGNGEKLGKNDYFLRRDGSIAVLDAARFVSKLDSTQLESYCAFLERPSGSRSGLQDWLSPDPKLMSLAEESASYATDTKLARRRNGDYQYLDVWQCVKDSHGRPYVPGSSVKGVLRTALLTYAILEDPSRWADELARVEWDFRDKGDMESALKGIAARIEGKILRSGGGEATEDLMRFVSVSDSDPLGPSCLVFAKKYDKFSREDDGSHKHDMGNLSDDPYYEGNELNIYRECIGPGTEVTVGIDIDERVDGALGFELDREGLERVLEKSHALYEETFLGHFDHDAAEAQTGGGQSAGTRCRYVIQEGPFAGQRCRNTAVAGTGYCTKHQDQAGNPNEGGGCLCYLGGGVGFDGKTIVSALLRDDPERVSKISRILYAQFPTKVDPEVFGGLVPRVREAGFEPKTMSAQYKRDGRLGKGKEDHRHWQDVELGVSPHTLKMGIVGKRKYQMGLCEVRVEER